MSEKLAKGSDAAVKSRGSKARTQAADTEGDSKAKAGDAAKRRKKSKKIVTDAKVVILARFNNTIVCFTDKKGNKLVQASAGSCGFRGSRKSTPFAAQVAVETAANQAKEYGVRNVEVWVKGPGPGREGGLRALANAGFTITEICDVTPIPHNGVRPAKRRRV